MFGLATAFIIIGVLSSYYEFWQSFRIVMYWLFVYYSLCFAFASIYWLTIFYDTAKGLVLEIKGKKDKFLLTLATIYSFFLLSAKFCIPYACYIVGAYVLSITDNIDMPKIIYACILISLGCILDFFQKGRPAHVRKIDN